MQSSHPPKPSTVVLLPAAMAVATVFYTMLAVLATFLIEDLGVTRAELGWVVAVFSTCSAAISPSIGRVADRLGAKRALLWVFSFVGAGFVLMSMAGALLALMAAAVVVAIGQAMANPSTNKMIAQRFPSGRRGLMTGVKQSGVQMGAFVGGAVFPSLAIARGWQSAPLLIGTAALVLLVLAGWRLPRDAEHAEPRSSVKAPLPPGTMWITLYAFLMGAGGSPIFSFFPLYAQEAVGVTETHAGWLVAIGGLVGLASRILWSVAAERVGSWRPMIILAAGAVVSALLTMAAEPVGVWMLWLSTVVTYTSISAWNSVAMLTIITTAGPTGAGRASGVVLMGFLAGLAVSPPLFGWSVDRLETYQPGFAVVVALFLLAVVTMLAWKRSATPVVT